MYKILGDDGQEYGPVSIEQVRQWIKENRLDGYFNLAEYPAAVAAELSAAQSAGSANAQSDSFSGVPAEAYGINP